MNDSAFTAIFYDTPNGEKPAEDFLLKLEPKMKAKMLRLVDMLEANGNDSAVHIPRI